jgi:hypothetical protein
VSPHCARGAAAVSAALCGLNCECCAADVRLVRARSLSLYALFGAAVREGLSATPPPPPVVLFIAQRRIPRDTNTLAKIARAFAV